MNVNLDADRLPPSTEQGPAGKIRPFWRGFFLTVFTLGLYPLWWHYRTHQEVMDFLGRPNRAKYVWFAYIVAMASLLLFVFLVFLPAVSDYEATHGQSLLAQDNASAVPAPTPVEPVAEEPMPHHSSFPLLAFLGSVGLLKPYLTLIGLSLAAFSTYLILQHRRIYRITDRYEAWGAAAFFFLFLWFGSWLLFQIPITGLISFLFASVIPLAMVMLAYHSLQTTYNNVWTDVEESLETHRRPPEERTGREPLLPV